MTRLVAFRGCKNAVLRLVVAVVLWLTSQVGLLAGTRVEMVRAPNGGIQPRAIMGEDGRLHVIYYSGDAAGGDVYYTHRGPGEATFRAPIRVNQQDGAAVAAGTIRGAQMALGRGGRVHVAWMGSAKVATGGGDGGAKRFPMLYTRLTDDGDSFEPERNLLTWTGGLDGGGSIAADGEGNVYVAWHGRGAGNPEGEKGRAVYVSHSRDDGLSFAKEIQANGSPTGACGCCGLRAFSGGNQQLYLLYRTASGESRDMALLSSNDTGRTFRLTEINRWRIDACPMSSAAFASHAAGLMVATERGGQVEVRLVGPDLSESESLLGGQSSDRKGKHPSLAVNQRGEILLVWSEGAGWRTGGVLRWEIYGADGGLKRTSGGESARIPDWSFASAVSRKDGSFLVVY